MKKLLSKKQVAAKLATTTRTIDRKRQAGTFPKPIDFGGPKWPEDQIDAWIESRQSKSDA